MIDMSNANVTVKRVNTSKISDIGDLLGPIFVEFFFFLRCFCGDVIVLKRVKNSDTAERDWGKVQWTFGLVRHGNKLTLSGLIKK
jgi:hypothetical protein